MSVSRSFPPAGQQTGSNRSQVAPSNLPDECWRGWIVNTERLFSDDPVDGTEVAPDVLGRRAYAEHVVALLERVRDQSDSSVLAMIAPWGAGKSSVLAMTISLLKAGGDADGWLVAEYNPWTYSDLESLVQGFFAELRQALPKDARWREAKQRLGEFAKAIDLLFHFLAWQRRASAGWGGPYS